MKRITVLHYTGATANNPKIAKRLSRKIRAIQRNGECVLVDLEDVEPTDAFVDVLLEGAHPEKIKFCGISIMLQIKLALRLPEKGTLS